MEEDNLKSLCNYLKNEEWHQRVHVIKPSTVGLKVRWKSHIGEVAVAAYDPALQHPYQVYCPSWTSLYAPNVTPGQSWQMNTPHPTCTMYHHLDHPQPLDLSLSNCIKCPNTPSPMLQKSLSLDSPSMNSSTATTTSSSKQPVTPSAPTTPQQYANQYYPYSYYNLQAQPPHSQYQPYGPYYASQPQQNLYTPGQPSLTLTATLESTNSTQDGGEAGENLCRAPLNEEQLQERLGWRETMDALFGKHADWDNVKVYIGKNRPNCVSLQAFAFAF